MKRILVTAGTVYGKLDDNKLVGNRIRGIWASRFASWLACRGCPVTLLVPDTFDKSVLLNKDLPPPEPDVRYHSGYYDYAEQCYALAPNVDAAVMAAAVVNWIPKEPFKGKMPTEGFEEGAVQNIPFILAPRVIDRMRKLNPRLTLIGCKMTSGADKEDLLRIAYGTLLKAHCNVVVANDLKKLKEKMLVYPDGHGRVAQGFGEMYEHLRLLIEDSFYRTIAAENGLEPGQGGSFFDSLGRFDKICDEYRDRFRKRPEGPDAPGRVFGSIAVRMGDAVLVSPREKGAMFSSEDAVVVTGVDRKNHTITTIGGKKATLNAPLLWNVMNAFDAECVVHLHEEMPGKPCYPYAPPGSSRDNDRPFSETAFNIEGHGCVFVHEPGRTC